MSILLVYSLLLQQPQPKSRSSKNFGRYWGRCVSQCFCYLFWLGSALCVNFFHLIEWPTILISRVGVFHYCNSVVQKIPPLYWYKEKKKKSYDTQLIYLFENCFYCWIFPLFRGSPVHVFLHLCLTLYWRERK